MIDRSGTLVLGLLLPAALIVGACGVAAAAEIARQPPAPAALSPGSFEVQSVRQWRADGTRGLWLEIAGGRWLYATFRSPCADLPASVSARFQWALGNDMQLGAAVKTAAGSECAVSRIHEVKAAGSTAPIGVTSMGTADSDLDGLVVEGRQVPPATSQEVPRCGLRSVVWALTQPGSAWRLLTPVESTGPASACLAPGYRWSPGVVP
jgi:hypothetical protein